LGFTSDLALMPDARLGIVVLTNSGSGEAFHSAVRQRAIELVFGQPMEYDARFTYAHHRRDCRRAAGRDRQAETLSAIRVLRPPLDARLPPLVFAKDAPARLP
jgi:hypothetical protein